MAAEQKGGIIELDAKLPEGMEAFDNPRRKATRFPDNPEDIDAYVNNIPLFSKARPSKDKQGDAWKMVEAIEANQDPKVKATELKNNGNECFKAGPKRWKDAITFYTQAIDEECGDARLDSVCLSNRALIHMKQKNYGKCIDDCKLAIEKNPRNPKAYLRAGQASWELGKRKEAMRWYEWTLKRAGDDFLKKNYVVNLIKKSERILEEDRKKAEEKRRRKVLKEKAEDILANAIKLRDVQITGETLNGEYKPKLDDKGCIHWPVLFMYPEFLQTDFIQDFHELRTFKDQLSLMFPPKGSSPPWDKKGAYRLSELEVFVEVKSKTAHSVRKVGIEDALAGGLTTKGNIVAGVPTFMVLSKASQYFANNFLKTHKVLS
uniref:Cns1/TTC4 wheel domain-containing protein n=1 Tax=Lotharella oceanica TaxID=641309 RepID=A0A7S2X907_9EUKA